MTTTLTDRVSQLAKHDAKTNQDHERQRFSRYVALLSKGDKATKAEANELYELMQSLGFTVDDMRDHTRVLTDFQRFDTARREADEAREQADVLADEVQKRDQRCELLKRVVEGTSAADVPDAAMKRVNELRAERGDTDTGFNGLDDHQRETILRDVLTEWIAWRNNPKVRQSEYQDKARQLDQWRRECDALRKRAPRLIDTYETLKGIN